MKAIERFFIAFCVVGLLFRMLIKPYDPLLQCIGFVGLAACYIVGGLLLVANIPLRSVVSRAAYAGLQTKDVLVGLLYGLVAGYSVLAILIHTLGWTEATFSIMMLLAVGSLVFLTITAAITLGVKRSSFYRSLIIRCGLLLLCLVAALILKPTLFPGRVLNYLYPH